MGMPISLVEKRFIEAKLDNSPLDIRYKKKNGRMVRRRI